MGGPAADRLPQRFDDEQKYGIHRVEVEEQANHIVVEKKWVFIYFSSLVGFPGVLRLVWVQDKPCLTPGVSPQIMTCGA